MSRRSHSSARKILKAVKPDSPTKWGLVGAAAAGGAVAISQIWEGPANFFAYVVAAVAESPALVIAGTAALGSAAAFFLADTTTAAVQTCGSRACRKEIAKKSDTEYLYSPLVEEEAGDFSGIEYDGRTMKAIKAIKARCKEDFSQVSLEGLKPNTPTKVGILAALLASAGVGFSAISNIPVHAYQEAWAMLAGANITQIGNQTVIAFANQTMAAGSHTAVWAFTSTSSALTAFQIAVITTAFLMTCGPKGCRKEYVDVSPEILTGSFATSVNKGGTRLNAAPGQPEVGTSGDEDGPPVVAADLGY